MSYWSALNPHPDVLGRGFEAVTIPLLDDDEGPVCATLVRRGALAPTARAVLYVHGYNDYFFQAHLADYFAARGMDFYALDLRKSGRSLRPGQTPHFMRDVSDHEPELDAALRIIAADGHTEVLVNAHSTGALIVAAWLARNGSAQPAHAQEPTQGRVRTSISGVIFNSPFLALSPEGPVKDTTSRAVGPLARFRPYQVVQDNGLNLYGQSIHADYRGEWRFDLALKSLEGRPIRAGWLAAVRAAQQRVQSGLCLEVPILVLTSDRSVRVGEWDERLRSGDAVLDVERITAPATKLGRHVTCIRVPGALHDVVLSAEPVRTAVFEHMSRWIGAYL